MNKHIKKIISKLGTPVEWCQSLLIAILVMWILGTQRNINQLYRNDIEIARHCHIVPNRNFNTIQRIGLCSHLIRSRNTNCLLYGNLKKFPIWSECDYNEFTYEVTKDSDYDWIKNEISK